MFCPLVTVAQTEIQNSEKQPRKHYAFLQPDIAFIISESNSASISLAFGAVIAKAFTVGIAPTLRNKSVTVPVDLKFIMPNWKVRPFFVVQPHIFDDEGLYAGGGAILGNGRSGITLTFKFGLKTHYNVVSIGAFIN